MFSAREYQDIRLGALRLRNFKGVSNFDLVLEGKNANVYGDNATGKTTLWDAFLWVLFDKDSTNRTNFSVKTLDADGNAINYLEHEVILEILVNGTRRSLRKVMTEKWVQKKGQPTKEFSGHETKYWVDDVPSKAKEYTDRVSALLNEGIFKLLTNPFFFCSDTLTPWQTRRKILMEMVGSDLSDIDVINSDDKLADLKKMLEGGRDIADAKKMTNEKIKELNKEIEKIPSRIDENNRTLATLNNTLIGINYEQIEVEIETLKQEIEKIEAEMAQAGKAVAAMRELQQEANRLECKLDERKRALDAQAGAGMQRSVDEKAKLEREKYRLETDDRVMEDKRQRQATEINEIVERLEDLRKAWAEAVANEFQIEDDALNCPTCGQALPYGRREEKVAVMRSDFETKKAQAVSKTDVEGRKLAEHKNNLQADNDKITDTLMKNEANLVLIAERLAELDKEIKQAQTEVPKPNYMADADYAGHKALLDAVHVKLNQPVADTTAEAQQRKRSLQTRIEELKTTLRNREVAENTGKRIDDLKQEEKDKMTLLSEYQRQQYLLDQFTISKVNLTKDRVNGLFSMVQFTMFKTQINGGIEELCEPTVDGVPWVDANHAKKVNAGLDIINALSRHYGCGAPIFIDFRESVSEILPTESQVINLIKVKGEKVLNVEVTS